MKINVFLQTYYLHDSLVKEIIHDNNTVDMTIDFCFWMQKDYNEQHPETGIIHLRFIGVTDYCGPSGTIDDYSILEADYHDHCLSILLMDDFNNVSYELKMISSSELVEIHT